jgi:hypothetical protein
MIFPLRLVLLHKINKKIKLNLLPSRAYFFKIKNLSPHHGAEHAKDIVVGFAFRTDNGN